MTSHAESESNTPNFFRVARSYGIITGLLMAVLLLIVQILNSGFTPAFNFSIYLLLGISIIMYLKWQKDHTESDKIFPRGMLMGNALSLFAALTVVVSSVIIYSISPDMAVHKYDLVPNGFKDVMVIGGALFFETIVFGVIFTFFALQFLKEKVKM